MTLSQLLQELDPNFMEKLPQATAVTMCDIVSAALMEAADEGRLVKGLNECANTLSSKPTSVVICVLPVDSSRQDDNLNIQLVLAESLCLEYDILTIKLDIGELKALASVTCTSQYAFSKSAALCKCSKSDDSNLDCFLIQRGKSEPGCCEKKLLNLVNDVLQEGEHFTDYGESPA